MIRIFSQDVSPKTVMLAGVECALMATALVFGAKLRFWNSPLEFDSYTRLPDFGVQAALFIGVFQLCLYYSDFNDVRLVRNRCEQVVCLGQSLGAGCMLLALVYYLVPTLQIGRGVFFISTVLVAASTIGLRFALDTAWRAAPPIEKVLVVGAGELATVVGRELADRDDLGVRIVGFMREPRSQHNGRLFGAPVYDAVESIEEIVGRERVSWIIVAVDDRRGGMPVRDLVKLKVQGVKVEDAHSAIAALTGRVWLQTVQPSWFVFSDGFRRSRTTLILKRTLDLFFGALGLILSLPLMALVAIAVRLDSAGSPIYRQERVGLRGKTFKVLKFRSMRVDAEKSGAQWAQRDDPRVTRLGRFLRKSRIDELPQFINVIKGDMSFVGPRPERPVFVEQLRNQISYYDERHSVRPGVTGWAQTQYQYGATIEDAYRKLEYDLFYLKNMTIFFDFAIILQTVRIVLSGRGGR
jgi:sugar transferase (PEP-CTERM system associated)